PIPESCRERKKFTSLLSFLCLLPISVEDSCFFFLKDEGLHPISQLFLKCTGLQQLGRREPFTPDALPLF
ncbi:hypothetical protein, partial [Bacteroides heparinolyticus]|uniref:hypothetical protein n=1 Tax=Prevotella heparinolytica TaxID=28113 RepID=UPI0035A16466